MILKASCPSLPTQCDGVDVKLQTSTKYLWRHPLELISTHVLALNQVDHVLKLVRDEVQDKAIHITIEPWKSGDDTNVDG
jgi:hypothetical protein